MSERRTRSGGAVQRSGPRTSLTKPSKSSKRKSGSDLPNTFPEVWPKTTPAAPVRKAIILKKIVPRAVEVPDVHTPVRRSPRISLSWKKRTTLHSRCPLRRTSSRRVASLALPPAPPCCALRMLSLTLEKWSRTPEIWKCLRKSGGPTVGYRASIVPQPPPPAADPSLALRDLKTCLESHLSCVQS